MLNTELSIRDCLKRCSTLGIKVVFLDVVGLQAHTDAPYVAIQLDMSEEEVYNRLQNAITLRENEIRNTGYKKFYDSLQLKSEEE